MDGWIYDIKNNNCLDLFNSFILILHAVSLLSRKEGKDMAHRNQRKRKKFNC